MTSRVLPFVYESLSSDLEARTYPKLELGTYIREVERYGGERCIEAAEALFSADSRAVVQLLAGEDEDARDERWQVVLVGLHHLLGDAALSLTERIQLLERMHVGYAAEMPGARDDVRSALSETARAERNAARGIVDAPPHWLTEIFEQRSAVARPVLRHIRANTVSAPYPGIVTSVLHLHAVRAFAAEPRAHEFILTRLLRDYYLTKLAVGQ